MGNLVYNEYGPGLVLQLDPATGALSTNAQINFPDDTGGLVLATNGDLIVMRWNNDGWSPAPDFIRINPNTGQQQFLPNTHLLTEGLGMDMAPDGTLIVAGQAGYLNGLFTVDPSNGQQRLLATNSHTFELQAVVVDTEGGIYVAESSYPQNVLHFNRDGTGRRVVSSFWVAGGVCVAGLALGPSGRLYCTDAYSHSVVRIDTSSGAQTTVSSGNNLSFPAGITVAPNGDIFVTDLVSHKIVKIDPATGAQVVLASNQRGPNAIRFISSGPPKLSIRFSGQAATLAWTRAATNYLLESASQPFSTASWSVVTNSPADTAWQKEVILAASQGCQFFRLRKSP